MKAVRAGVIPVDPEWPRTVALSPSLIRIVGLGPGDPHLLTLGSLEALRVVGRVMAILAPPELMLFLESEGVTVVPHLLDDPSLFVRGSIETIEALVARLDSEPIAIGILGNPLSDFPGLPILLRSLERRKCECELVPGVPRATLQASLAMPLVPLPPMSTRHSFDDLVEIMARLRRSCPWDREQTHRSLTPNLIEEAYEVVEAIEIENEVDLCEELGDLFLQIVFHAQLATERGKFSIADVIDGLSNKMVRRHPHVFGDTQVHDVAEVWQNWDALKSLEAAGQRRESKLDGIPKALGALQRAQKMQVKAARVGFDWPTIDGVLAKLAEELAEFEQARRHGEIAEIIDELGDVLFSLVNVARTLAIDAEGALRAANEKFYRRFTHMERSAVRTGRTLSDLSIDEMEDLWKLAKMS